MLNATKRKDVFDTLYGGAARAKAATRRQSARGPHAIPVTALADYTYAIDDGEKFYGGFGPTNVFLTDYWTLRARSSQLFETNHYARGLIRRLVTNEINTGLNLECTPEEKILGYEREELDDWTEDIENRFVLWAKDPFLCDVAERRSFGALQIEARMEALISGDVLVTIRQHPLTGLPRIQLISGACVQSPLMDVTPQRGNTIKHGVELDSFGRHVAFWIRQADGTSKRLPAFGEKTGRRLAWLVYGTDKRLDDVRGKPLLALVLQSLKEIDRYRDSVQRKAAVLAMLAMFITKGADKPGTRPMTGGAVRRGAVDASADPAGRDRQFKTLEHIPGFVIDELQYGEEPKAFQTNGTVEAFGVFEDAIISSIAWCNEIPPEIMKLAFSSNYSASQAANNEFRQYINKIRTFWGETFCGPIYQEWILSETLLGRVEAPRLLDAWRDPKLYYLFNAWVANDWAGNIKPAVDPTKLVKGTAALVAEGFMTRDRAARELTGMKFSKVVQRLKRENELLAEARRPLLELEQQTSSGSDPGDDEGDSETETAQAAAEDLEERVVVLEERMAS